MVFPKYRKYRNTGVDWIGHIPDHWSTKAVKYVSLVNPSGDRAQKDEQVTFLPMEAVLTNGQFDASRVDVRNTFPASLTEFKRGDVLLAKITPCFENGKGTFVEELPTLKGIGSTEFHVFRVCKDQLTPRFLYYAIHNEAFRTYAEVFMEGTAGQKRVTTPFISNTKIPVPPIEDQKRIVEFLDRKTSEIDQAIAQKQRLIELLQEQKAILINQAVTKGLDSNVSMCDSGIEWIGKIPKHWKLKRVKNVSSFVTSGPRGWAEYYADEGSFFLQSGNLNNSMGIELEKANKVQPPNGAEGRRTRLRNNDVLVCITGANTGRVAIAKLDEEEVYINQHLCLIRPTQDIYSDFLSFCLHSAVGQTHFFLSQYGLKEGLGLEDVKNAVILEPPLDEQKEITKFLSEFIEELDRVEAKTLNQIARLSEMKSIFIAEAVTGKIRV